MERFQTNPPIGGSSLLKAFQQRQDMETNNQNQLEQIDDYIDKSYDLGEYVDDVEPIEYTQDYFNNPRYDYTPRDDSNRNSYKIYNGPYNPSHIPNEVSPSYSENDGMSLQKRITSIHRNKAMNPRDVEIQRKWIYAATLTRQPLEQHVDRIVDYMKQDKTLIDDSQDAELSRKQALRDMPQCLAIKKRVKRKFVSSIGTSRSVGMFQMLKYSIAMSWSHLKRNTKELLYMLELWYSDLKTIEGNFGSGVASYFKFLRWLFLINLAMTILCICFVTIPQVAQEQNENTATFSAMDLLTGYGYLDKSLMYYGSYSYNMTSTYDIPKAYFYTMPVVYVAMFILISVSMAASYRRSFIETRGGLQDVFAHKIFCGWDYSIATKKAASLKSKSIYNELMELLSDVNRIKPKLSFCDKFRLYAMQTIAHAFAVVVSLSAGYLMYTLLEKYYEDSDILLAVFINIVMVIVPMIFRVIASYEDYKKPKVMLFITLARTIFLEICVIAVLIYYGLKDTNSDMCWENKLAQEVYRLIIFDFFFSTLFMTLVDLAWYLMHKTFNKIEAPEFDIATNTLSLFYNQTLFWIGFYFSPLLGAMVVLKLFLTWYVRSIILLKCCEAPKKSWRAAQTESWFLIIAFLWSLILLFVHGFHIFSDTITSSTNCGPLRNSEFAVLANSDISFIFKPGVIACVLIALAFGVYYLRAVANAQIDMVDFLRDRLNLASQDKEFLLKHIDRVSKGEFKYKKADKQVDYIDPSKLAPNISRSNEEFHDGYGENQERY